MLAGQGAVRLSADHHLYGNIHRHYRAAGRQRKFPPFTKEFFEPRSLQRGQKSTVAQAGDFTKAVRCVVERGEPLLKTLKTRG